VHAASDADCFMEAKTHWLFLVAVVWVVSKETIAPLLILDALPRARHVAEIPRLLALQWLRQPVNGIHVLPIG
jgi:hypothetical protein